MKYIVIFIIFTLPLSCSFQENITNKNFTEKTKRKYTKTELIENDEISKHIKQLTSPSYFKYTEAARKLINMGEKAVEKLYEQRNLIRESGDTLVPVCVVIIKIIFEKQNENWIKSKLKTELREIALAELKRRKKKREKEEKKRKTKKKKRKKKI